MGAATFWLLVALPWAAVGVATAIVMGRRGHYLPAWIALGIAFGPLLIPLAVESSRHEREARARVLVGGRPGRGPVDVLVGVDGSPESRLALRAAVRLFGPVLGRLTAAKVVDYDTGMPGERPELDAERADLLRCVREELAGHAVDPDVLLLAGRPGPVLLDRAHAGGYDVLVVGSRGAGRTHALMGHVATHVARHASTPVLIGPAPAPGDEDTQADDAAVTAS